MEMTRGDVELLLRMDLREPVATSETARAFALIDWARTVPMRRGARMAGKGYVLTLAGYRAQQVAAGLELDPKAPRWFDVATRLLQRRCGHVRGWHPRPTLRFAPGHCVKCGKPLSG